MTYYGDVITADYQANYLKINQAAGYSAAGCKIFSSKLPTIKFYFLKVPVIMNRATVGAIVTVISKWNHLTKTGEIRKS